MPTSRRTRHAQAVSDQDYLQTVQGEEAAAKAPVADAEFSGKMTMEEVQRVMTRPDPVVPGLHESERESLRQAVRDTVVSSEAGPVGTDHKVTLTSAQALDQLSERIDRHTQTGAQAVVGQTLGKSDVPLGAQGKQELSAMSRSFAESLFDGNQGERAQEMNTVAREVGASRQLEVGLQDLKTASEFTSQGDTAAQMAFLNKLDDFKNLAGTAPKLDSPAVASLAADVGRLRQELPSGDAVVSAYEALGSISSRTAAQRQESAQRIEAAAADLQGLSQPGAQALRERLGEVAAALRSGDTAALAPAHDRAEEAAGQATREIAAQVTRAVDATLRRPGHGNEQSMQSFEKWADIATAGKPDLDGAGVARLLEAARQGGSLNEHDVLGTPPLAPADTGAGSSAGKAEGKMGAEAGVQGPVGSGRSEGEASQATHSSGGGMESSPREGTPAAPDAEAMQNLRELLGAGAKDLSDEQLQQAMGEGFAEKVEQLGITPEQVAQAKGELQRAAEAEGRDPAQVDNAVALEALVLREEALERNQQDPQADAHEAADAQSPAEAGDAEAQQRNAQDREAEAEMELEMEMSGGGGD